MDTIGIVDAALTGDAEAFKNSFDSAIADKVSDALEVRKIEIASTLIRPEESPDESEEIVDGTDADAVADENATDADATETEDAENAE